MAAITPGIHPHNVRIETKRRAPQPLSKTDKGGNRIATMALVILMV
jgi:hypothetical protein